MANDGGGGGVAAAPHCPEDLREFFGCLVTLVRQMEARVKAVAVENTHLLTEIEFLKREQNQRLEIAAETTQEIRRCMSLRDKMEEILEHETLKARRLAFYETNYLESFISLMSSLAGDNSELQKKLKEVESQADLTENPVDHQNSTTYARADVRKLKEAFKTMVLEKDKEISRICTERDFFKNQFKLFEEDFNDTCRRKNEELKIANKSVKELAATVHKLQLEVQEKDGEIGRLQAEAGDLKNTCSRKNEELKIANKSVKELTTAVHELRLEAQENDGEIRRLQAEVVRLKEIQNELKQKHIGVKSKDAETDLPETSQKWKKGLKETKRKTKLDGPVSTEKSRVPHVTPGSRGVKTSIKCVSSAKETHSQPCNNSLMHNTEMKRQSDTRQKRKRSPYTLSHSLRRCSTSLQVRPPASPTLFTPCFNLPNLASSKGTVARHADC